jgi:hypothetical protein
MTECEKELSRFYVCRARAEAHSLGPAPRQPEPSLRERRTLRVDFASGIAAAALACVLACAAPMERNGYFVDAAASLSSLRIEKRDWADFGRALGSAFAPRETARPGTIKEE